MEKRKCGYLNLLSVIAAFSVIILHTNEVFWEYNPEQRYWHTSLIIESFFYFAVPVFFLISGATLLNFYDRYNIRTYFKKRIIKTVIPFLFWSITGLMVHIFILKDMSFEGITVLGFINDIMSCGKYVNIFWFFRPLFILYIVIPLFAGIDKSKKITIYTYITISALVIDFLIPFLNSVFKINLNLNLTTIVGTYYIIFLLLGYLIHHVEFKPIYRIIIYIGGLIGFLFQYLGTYIYSERAGSIDKTFKGYTNIPAILQGVAVFVLVKYGYRFIDKNKKLIKVIDFIKDYTFAFYLLHWYIIIGIKKVFAINKYSIYWRLFGFIPIIMIIIVITWILRKIKIGKYILP
jgi:Uncharacterized protein conserved in bacteria